MIYLEIVISPMLLQLSDTQTVSQSRRRTPGAAMITLNGISLSDNSCHTFPLDLMRACLRTSQNICSPQKKHCQYLIQITFTTMQISSIFFAVLAASVLAVSESKPWEPEPRTEGWWIDRHNAFVENTRQNGSDIRIVFMGSSVMEYWSREGAEIFNGKYKPLGAVNYGIGGDQIQHCLWRLVNGEIENLNPKMLVLYCGSNNVPGNPSAAEITQGVVSTLNFIARKLPRTKILHVNINPRGDVSPILTIWDRIVSINQQVMQLSTNQDTVVFDMFDSLTEGWGNLRNDLYLDDKLHLNTRGYQHWDNAWNETFFNLWNGGV